MTAGPYQFDRPPPPPLMELREPTAYSKTHHIAVWLERLAASVRLGRTKAFSVDWRGGPLIQLSCITARNGLQAEMTNFAPTTDAKLGMDLDDPAFGGGPDEPVITINPLFTSFDDPEALFLNGDEAVALAQAYSDFIWAPADPTSLKRASDLAKKIVAELKEAGKLVNFDYIIVELKGNIMSLIPKRNKDKNK